MIHALALFLGKQISLHCVDEMMSSWTGEYGEAKEAENHLDFVLVPYNLPSPDGYIR